MKTGDDDAISEKHAYEFGRKAFAKGVSSDSTLLRK